MEREFDKHQVLNILKNIFELEMSGVVRYTHYSLMIFGSNRLPLVDFFRSQAKESLSHADLVGEHITGCLLYTSPSPRDVRSSRMPSSA